ncbi:cGMP-dependent protein kinase 1 [Dendroctonus ponderosae]|uniref:cGMP-dependent protein kinase 1 n=1 Tax=Dendroctonus ponderosae TaxID=77166 RepID=UPI002034D7C1|nr:cGMP-dependent protein kinase 1 [Dendroctonus ponderosae]
MTLKDLYKNRDKMKPKRRSGCLCPLNQQDSQGKSPFPAADVKTPKDDDLIRQALKKNEFLCNVLTEFSMGKLLECFQLKHLDPGEVLLEEGKINTHLFVLKNGTFEIVENEKKTCNVPIMGVFGELAILHSTRAPQTVRAVSQASVWTVDGSRYKALMVNARMQKRNETVDYLRNVPSLSKASEHRLYSLCDILRESCYEGKALLAKEDETIDNFFIVTSGSATILATNSSRRLDKLTSGCFYGENILKKDTISPYTIIADFGGVTCLVLSRQAFLDHYQDLDDFLHGKTFSCDHQRLNYEGLELKQLKKLKTLGVGGFGRVQLVQNTKQKDEIFALKLMKKHEIIGKTQIEQVYNEKKLQMGCDCPFIVRLFRTFRDTKYLYFLLEPCLGGDLWNLLKRQRRKYFDTEAAKFYAGCVLEALSYLHCRDIVYRDLKPENVMVASSGYLKLTDFGFAKKILPKHSSYSFVGTAEYLAPEIIQKLPHDKGVDYWALGIFIYELLVGKSPFRNEEHNDLKTYQAILRGFDFVTFPSIISPRARNLIKKLCKHTSIDRLGCLKNGVKDIQTHPWFSKLDWEKLRQKELEPPIRIALNGKTDTRYFESFKEDKEQVMEDFSAWDKDF